jgi:hypothetical protein
VTIVTLSLEHQVALFTLSVRTGDSTEASTPWTPIERILRATNGLFRHGTLTTMAQSSRPSLGRRSADRVGCADGVTVERVVRQTCPHASHRQRSIVARIVDVFSKCVSRATPPE